MTDADVAAAIGEHVRAWPGPAGVSAERSRGGGRGRSCWAHWPSCPQEPLDDRARDHGQAGRAALFDGLIQSAGTGPATTERS